MRFIVTILLLCCGLVYYPSSSQGLKNTPERKSAYRHDTALVNRLVNKAQDLVSLSGTGARDSADVYLQKIYTLSQARNYDLGLAEYYRLLSSVYNARYLYDSSGSSLRKEMYWARRSSEPIEIAETYAAMGIRYEHMDQLDSAAKYYIRAVHISDSVGNRHFSGSVYNNLAIIFYNIGDSRNAEKYALAGYRVGKELDDSTIFLSCLINLAGIKKDLLFQQDTALKIYQQVVKAVSGSGRYKSLAFNAYVNEGDVLATMKEYTRALRKYNSLLAYSDELGDYLLGYVYSGMGNTYLDMKDYPAAGKYVNKARQINERIHAGQELSGNYASLSEINKAEKHFDVALLYRERYDSIQDTLMAEANRKNMHLLDVKYQTAQKNKQIAQQQLALAKNRHAIERKNTWMLVLLGGAAAMAAILILSIRSYRHKRRAAEQSLLTLQKQHEVNTLQAKMVAREEERNRIGKEMHDDVGSALTTILYLSDDLKTTVDKKNQDTAGKIAATAGQVVDKMNEIIWSMNQQYDTLDDLIAYTRRHAAQFLESHGIEYDFRSPDPVPDIRLQGEQRRNIYLVVKESLHNIVKHSGATEVEIVFCLEGGLKVTVHDNGKGIDMAGLRRFGNGLRNMEQRMRSVGGSFGISASDGTLVCLECALNGSQ
jgi:signal transduction histidine kinase